MEIQQLFNKFNASTGWNAYLYVTYKILSTTLTVLLFKHLSTSGFSQWANINSCIFLVLLWLDFGLRKSIPRFCPEFAKNTHVMKKFLCYTIAIKFFILILSIPIMLSITTLFCQSVIGTTIPKTLYFLTGVLFVTEGLKSILQLIFHAHFWNKSFNILLSTTQTIEMLTNIYLINYITTSDNLLLGTFATKIIGGGVVVMISMVLLIALYAKQPHSNQDIDTKQLTQQFVKHSGIMWVNNNLKSLTERNFLVPLLTAILGPGQANIFKLANDGALLFYRSVIKTIGTNDTTLLAYVSGVGKKKRLMQIAFKKVTTKIAALCIPLSGILLLLSIYSNRLVTNPIVFQLFFIITSAYLIETIIGGYERVLEVNRRYMHLLYSYVPYICILFLLFTQNRIASVGLINTLLLIHGVRLVSSFIMAYCARTEYGLRFPVRYTLRLIGLLIPVGCILGILIEYSSFGVFMYKVIHFILPTLIHK